jgi:hypothetical protein
VDEDKDKRWTELRNQYAHLLEEQARVKLLAIPLRIYGETTETKPPADFSAHGREGAKVKRAVIQQRLTATERKAYRSGYQAGHKLRARWLEAVARVLRSLRPEG